MGGDDTDDLSTLIGEIYDTTLDAALWEQTLEKAAGFIGGSNAGLWSIDAHKASGGASYSWGFDFSYVRAYFEKYSRVDPAVTTYLVTGIGKPVALSAVIPRQEFLESRYTASRRGRRA